MTVGGETQVKRRQLLAFAMMAPLSVFLLSRTGIGRKYLQINGWVLRSDDI